MDKTRIAVFSKVSLQLWTPPLIATSFCWIVVAVLGIASAVQDSWRFVYPLDDTYIHLAMARTLIVSHVWGISAAEFGSASSSPGWTLLLAGVNWVFGVHVLSPLILNMAFAAGLLFFADFQLRCFAPRCSQSCRIWLLLFLVFFIPLPNLIFIGMEHVSQAVSVFLLVILGIGVLVEQPCDPIPRARIVGLVFAAFFAGSVRYEAVFTVVPLCLALLVRRRVSVALLVGLASAVTPVCFGIYSHRVSGYWLPFSVIIKKIVPETKGPMREHVHLAVMYPLLCFILAQLWFLCRRKERFWGPTRLLIFFTFLISLTHRLVAPTGWLLRYESYFVALFLFVTVIVIALLGDLSALVTCYRMKTAKEKVFCMALFASCLAIAPYFFYRAIMDGIYRTEEAAVDRYNEHLEVASFINQFYDSDAVVMNDIGAAAFYTHAHLLDVVGLGSQLPLDVLRKTGHPLDANDLQEWATSKRVHLAVLQTGWDYVIPRIPRGWIAVAQLDYKRNVVFTDRYLTFFATSQADVPRLCSNLAAFRISGRDTLIFEQAVCPEPR